MQCEKYMQLEVIKFTYVQMKYNKMYNAVNKIKNNNNYTLTKSMD